MTKTETVKHDKKELALSTAISLLSNLSAGDLADATAYIERLLEDQKIGGGRSNIVVEAGAVQEMDLTLDNMEYLIDRLEEFSAELPGRSFDDREAIAVCRMLMDYGEQLRGQLAELIDRI